MEKEQILQQFSQGFDCSQVVLTHLCDKHSLADEQTAKKYPPVSVEACGEAMYVVRLPERIWR